MADTDEFKNTSPGLNLPPRVSVFGNGTVDLMPDVKLRARMIEVAASLHEAKAVPSFNNVIDTAEGLLNWVLKNEHSSSEDEIPFRPLSKLSEHARDFHKK